jgi:hypothetical protein
MGLRFRSCLRSLRSSAGRDAGQAPRPPYARRAPSGGRGDDGGGRRCAPTLLRCSTSGSCGATRYARCASSAQTGRRKSEVRSALRAPTPRLRCSAPPTSPRPPEGARRAYGGRGACPASRPADDRSSGSVGGVRIEDGALAHEHHDGIGKGADRRVAARLVRSREAQQHRRRAQRASSIILAAICLSGARAASVASFAAPAGAASIAGHPREAGASTRRAATRRSAPLRAPTERAR